MAKAKASGAVKSPARSADGSKHHRQEIPLFRASSQHHDDLRAAKNDLSKRYFGKRAGATSRGAVRYRAVAALTPVANQNVVGVGLGEKVVYGKPAGIHAVKVFVKIKLPESEISRSHLLPKTVAGLPIDVEQTGDFWRLQAAVPNPRTKIRPAQPGCSVGFQDPENQFVMAGTFGALVKKGSDLLILSNNHVLADEGQLAIGSPIFQPGLLDGGNAGTDQIAELTQFVPLDTNNPNQVDCAIARVLKPSLVSRDILQIGPPAGTATATVDMVVHKFGRTTSYRAGRITSVDTDVSVNYETGTYTFNEQLIIVGLDGQAFSDSGDSGSLILERSSANAVGLLFAGSPTHTIANHIGDVLQALGVTLA
jgi:hypothetical protein